MQESLGLFKSLLNLGIFNRVNIYVLLNKVDIFQRMISKVTISDYFPGYTGGADCFNACKFFADKFYSISHRYSRQSETNIFPISAVDSESVSDVALCVRDLLERDSLKRDLSQIDSWNGASPERNRGPYDRVTAWSWAAMDPDFSRERRTYMETYSWLAD